MSTSLVLGGFLLGVGTTMTVHKIIQHLDQAHEIERSAESQPSPYSATHHDKPPARRDPFHDQAGLDDKYTMGDFELILPDQTSVVNGFMSARWGEGEHTHATIEVECSSALHHELSRCIGRNGWPEGVKIQPTEGAFGYHQDFNEIYMDEPDIEIKHVSCDHPGEPLAHINHPDDFFAPETSIHLANVEKRRQKNGGILNPHLKKTIEPPGGN